MCCRYAFCTPHDGGANQQSSQRISTPPHTRQPDIFERKNRGACRRRNADDPYRSEGHLQTHLTETFPTPPSGPILAPQRPPSACPEILLKIDRRHLDSDEPADEVELRRNHLDLELDKNSCRIEVPLQPITKLKRKKKNRQQLARHGAKSYDVARVQPLS